MKKGNTADWILPAFGVAGAILFWFGVLGDSPLFTLIGGILAIGVGVAYAARTMWRVWKAR